MNIIKPDGDSLTAGDLQDGQSFTVQFQQGECHLIDILESNSSKLSPNSGSKENDRRTVDYDRPGHQPERRNDDGREKM